MTELLQDLVRQDYPLWMGVAAAVFSALCCYAAQRALQRDAKPDPVIRRLDRPAPTPVIQRRHRWGHQITRVHG